MTTLLPVFDVRLDPPAVAQNRAQLRLNDGPIRIDQKGIDWGDAAIQAYMADKLYGSSPVDYRVPNREVSIPLFLGADESDGFDHAKIQLMNKVARLQAEGGWIQRQPGFYGDVVNATLTFPDVWGEAAGLEPDVVLRLECLPDFYGDEIQLDSITVSDIPPPNPGDGSGTGFSASWVSAIYGALKLNGQKAFIKGDYPGRFRLGVTTTEGYDMHGLLWGLRSRYYVDPTIATTGPAYSAQLAYNCHQLTAVNSASQQAGVASDTVFPLSVGGTWITGLTTTIPELGGEMTHAGTYRVWCTVYSDNVPQVRLGWVVGSQVIPTFNDAVTLPGDHNYYLVDLGEIRIDPTPSNLGQFVVVPPPPQTWKGLIQGYSALPGGGDTLYLKDLFLQPLDDGGGRLIYNNAGPASVVTTKPSTGGSVSQADSSATGNTAWNMTGDLAKLDNYSNVVHFSDATKISHYLVASGFGFAIPAGAVIQGIMVQITCKTDQVGGVFDNAVVMATNGVHPPDPPAGGVANPGSPATVSWPTGWAARTYGDPTNKWNPTTAWTPALINAAGFGVQISCKAGSVPSYPVSGYVDYVQIGVYYTLGSSPALDSDAVLYYQTGYTELRTEGMYRSSRNAASVSNSYAEVSRVIGDLPRIPPSGMEGRPCEVFVKPSSGDLGQERDALQGVSGRTPLFSLFPYYRPSYLFPP